MHGPQETGCRGLIDHVIPPVQFKHLGCGSWKTGRRDPRLLGSRKGLEREERHGNSVRPQRAASWLGTVPHTRACAHTRVRSTVTGPSSTALHLTFTEFQRQRTEVAIHGPATWCPLPLPRRHLQDSGQLPARTAHCAPFASRAASSANVDAP